MAFSHKNTADHRGVLSRIKSRFRKNRLGELLVLDGYLSAPQLKEALDLSKVSGQQLGYILVSQNYVTKNLIRRKLTEQMMLRLLLATVTILVAMTSMGLTKKAKAGPMKDVPASISLVQASFNSVSQYPEIFGSVEKKSTSMSAFTKWTGMFDRFDTALKQSSGQKEVEQLKIELSLMKGLPLRQIAEQVNDLMNSKRYVSDASNYGQNDYWATPVEFFKRGGDCEDYAIAKYTALRMLGVPENRMRVAIVQDTEKNIPHAILIVYSDQGAIILDNQIKTVKNANRISHYKPIFSINQDAWWLHTAPRGSVTVVASAAR